MLLTLGPNDDLQSALMAASGEPDSVVRLAPGVYDLPAQGLEFGAGCRIKGAGPEETILCPLTPPSADAAMLRVHADESASVRGVWVQGHVNPQGRTVNGIVHGGGSGGLRLESVRVSEADNAVRTEVGAVSLEIVDSDLTARSNGVLSGTLPGNQVGYSWSIQGTRIHDIGSTNQDHGVYCVTPFARVDICGCRFENITGAALHRAGGENVDSGWLRFRGSEVLDCGVSGGGALILKADAPYHGDIVGNYVKTPSRGMNIQAPVRVEENAILPGSTGIVVQGSSLPGTISGNWIYLRAGSGPGIAFLDGQHGWRAEGNRLIALEPISSPMIDVDGVRDLVLKGQIYRLDGRSAVRVRNLADRIAIEGEQATGTTNHVGTYEFDASAMDPITAFVRDCHNATSDRAGTQQVQGVERTDCYERSAWVGP